MSSTIRFGYSPIVHFCSIFLFNVWKLSNDFTPCRWRNCRANWKIHIFKNSIYSKCLFVWRKTVAPGKSLRFPFRPRNQCVRFEVFQCARQFKRCAIYQVSVVGKLTCQFNLMIVSEWIVDAHDQRPTSFEHFNARASTRVTDYCKCGSRLSVKTLDITDEKAVPPLQRNLQSNLKNRQKHAPKSARFMSPANSSAGFSR